MFLEGHFQIMPLKKPKLSFMEVRLHLYWFIAYVIQNIKSGTYSTNMPSLEVLNVTNLTLSVIKC